jgi:Heparinase II/III-like protein
MIPRSVYIPLIFCICLAAQSPLAASPDRGVFFEPQHLSRYRELFTGNPLFSDLRKQMDTIDRARERKFLRSEVRYNDHLYDIARVGNLAQQMALLYLFTGDTDAVALAQECVETLMKFPRWDYFLEGGSDVIGLQRAPNSAIAVALVVEALGERVPLSLRKRWLATMAERGTEPSYRATYGMRYPDRVKGWTMDTTSTYFLHRPLERGISLARWPIILNTINLKAIPASALALSALVYREVYGETDDTKRWLEQATYSIGTFRDIYARDGSYNEGISYAHYTTLHIIQAVDALRRAGVADLTDMINWNGYQDYLLEMTLPTEDDPHAIVNFSDAGTGANASPSFWISRETRDGLARWFGETLALSRDLWSVLYYDPTVPLTPPHQGLHLWYSDLGWIVGRTGYQPADLVVAMRSGGPSNHEHADRNGLIVKCYGERLVVDPMRPPYSFRDPAWKMRLTAGHSCVLIDGKGHQYVDGHEGTNASQASATVIRRGERDGYLFWTSDATPAYRLVLPDVQSVTRTVVTLTDPPALVVVDKVIKKSQPSTVQARFYADNTDGKGTIAATKDAFMVTRPHAYLVGTGSSGAGVVYSSSVPDIPQSQARLYPFADVGTVQPEKEICLVTVLLPSTSNGPIGTARVHRDGPVYTARVSVGDRTVSVKVIDSGIVPEFEVETQ